MPDDASPYAYQFVSGDDPESPPLEKAAPLLWEFPLNGLFSKNKWETTVSCVVSFQLDMKLWKWTPYIRPPDVPGKPEKYFSVSTQDSRVLKPTLVVDGVKVSEEFFTAAGGRYILFGPYIESITVEMWFDHPQTVLKQYAPSTDIEHGSESQSYGISFGFNGGFFGDAPTAGASLGFSYSTSHSISLADFELRCASDNETNKSQQVLSLTMKGDGSRYEGPGSLDFINVDTPDPTHLLPPRAFGDIPFPYDGIWELPGDSNDTVDFHIRVTVVCPMRGGYLITCRVGNSEPQPFVRPIFVWDRIVKVPLGVSFEKPKNGHRARLPLR